MASLKSGFTRALWPKAPNQSPRLWNGVSRGIATTIKNANSLTSNTESTISFPFNTQGFQQRISSQDQLTIHSQSKSTPFDNLREALTKTLVTTTTSTPTVPTLSNLMRSYTSNRTHWVKFAYQNPSKQYTRNLVHEVPDLFNLLILVWTPGKKSPIHDHANAHCLMKVLQGSLQETRYAIPSNPGSQGPLVQTSQSSLGLNKVGYMADALGLHSISNPSLNEYAVSLHLYFPPHAATRGSKVYDEMSGEVKRCMGSYDSIRGEVV